MSVQNFNNGAKTLDAAGWWVGWLIYKNIVANETPYNSPCMDD